MIIKLFSKKGSLVVDPFLGSGTTIIACEKTPPYASGVYELSTALVQLGAYEVLRLMERYAECIDTDTWDAYGNTIQTLELPAWATPQIG